MYALREELKATSQSKCELAAMEAIASLVAEGQFTRFFLEGEIKRLKAEVERLSQPRLPLAEEIQRVRTGLEEETNATARMEETHAQDN